jgi:hypothetical protein
MGPFVAAVIGSLVGALGTGVVTWIAQSRAWEHESRVRAKERRLAVMPYVTFKVEEPPVARGTTPEGRLTFMRFPRVTMRNDGFGPARFSVFNVSESFKDAIRRQPVPSKGLTLLGVPVHLNAGEQCEITMAVKDVDGLEVEGGTKHEFELWDLYGNHYTSLARIFKIVNERGTDEWLISTGLPQIGSVSRHL